MNLSYFESQSTFGNEHDLRHNSFAFESEQCSLPNLPTVSGFVAYYAYFFVSVGTRQRMPAMFCFVNSVIFVRMLETYGNVMCFVSSSWDVIGASLCQGSSNFIILIAASFRILFANIDIIQRTNSLHSVPGNIF